MINSIYPNLILIMIEFLLNQSRHICLLSNLGTISYGKRKLQHVNIFVHIT
jgi:hypothetical protein